MSGSRCLLVLLIGGLLAAPCRAATSDERFVEGLVQRRLFSLAELVCRQQLADTDLSLRDQVDWTVELVRITALHAAHSLPAARAERWQAAHQAAQLFLAATPDHSRSVLVKLQDALASLAEG